MTTILSKFQGALVGAVVGDCIGAVFEHLWAETINPEKVKHATDKIESESEKEEDYKIWTFTDDTAMARSVAKSLIECKGFDEHDMAERFTENFMEEPDRGYGGGVISVFDKLKKLDNYQGDVFQPAREQFGGEGSYGNGGAMRIVPAALFSFSDGDPEKSNDLVTKITSLTHTHRMAILGANLQCYAVDMALNSSPTFSPDEMVDTLITLMKMIEEEPKKSRSKPETGHASKGESVVECSTYVQKLELIKDYLSRDKEPDTLTVHTELGADIEAFDAVPAAVYSFLRSNIERKGFEDKNPFKKTVMYAISLGGDSDTVATMAGAIAGACYGLESIPKSWQKCCEGVDDAKRFGEELFKLQKN